jgi:hypothetical protein
VENIIPYGPEELKHIQGVYAASEISSIIRGEVIHSDTKVDPPEGEEAKPRYLILTDIVTLAGVPPIISKKARLEDLYDVDIFEEAMEKLNKTITGIETKIQEGEYVVVYNVDDIDYNVREGTTSPGDTIICVSGRWSKAKKTNHPYGNAYVPIVGSGGKAASASGAVAIITSPFNGRIIDDFVADAAWSIEIYEIPARNLEMSYDEYIASLTNIVFLASFCERYDDTGKHTIQLKLATKLNSEGIPIPIKVLAMNGSPTRIEASFERPMIGFGSLISIETPEGEEEVQSFEHIFIITNYMDFSMMPGYSTSGFLQVTGHQGNQGARGYSNVDTAECGGLPPETT